MTKVKEAVRKQLDVILQERADIINSSEPKNRREYLSQGIAINDMKLENLKEFTKPLIKRT